MSYSRKSTISEYIAPFSGFSNAFRRNACFSASFLSIPSLNFSASSDLVMLCFMISILVKLIT